MKPKPVSGVGVKDSGLVASGHANDDVGAVHGMNLVILRLVLVTLFGPGGLARVGLRLGVAFRLRLAFGLTFRLGLTLGFTLGF